MARSDPTATTDFHGLDAAPVVLAPGAAGERVAVTFVAAGAKPAAGKLPGSRAAETALERMPAAAGDAVPDVTNGSGGGGGVRGGGGHSERDTERGSRRVNTERRGSGRNASPGDGRPASGGRREANGERRRRRDRHRDPDDAQDVDQGEAPVRARKRDRDDDRHRERARDRERSRERGRDRGSGREGCHSPRRLGERGDPGLGRSQRGETDAEARPEKRRRGASAEEGGPAGGLERGRSADEGPEAAPAPGVVLEVQREGRLVGRLELGLREAKDKARPVQGRATLFQMLALCLPVQPADMDQASLFVLLPVGVGLSSLSHLFCLAQITADAHLRHEHLHPGSCVCS